MFNSPEEAAYYGMTYCAYELAEEKIDFKQLGRNIWQKILDIVEKLQQKAMDFIRTLTGVYQLEIPRDMAGMVNAFHHILPKVAQEAVVIYEGALNPDSPLKLDKSTALAAVDVFKDTLDDFEDRVDTKVRDYMTNRKTEGTFVKTVKFDYKMIKDDINLISKMAKKIKAQCLYCQVKARKMEEAAANDVRTFANGMLATAVSLRRCIALYSKMIFSSSIKGVNKLPEKSKTSPDRPYYADQSLDESRTARRAIYNEPIDVAYREVNEAFIALNGGDYSMVALEADTKSLIYFRKSYDIHKKLRKVHRLVKKYTRQLKKGTATDDTKQQMLEATYEAISALEVFRNEVNQIPEQSKVDKVLTVISAVVKLAFNIVTSMALVGSLFSSNIELGKKVNRIYKAVTAKNLSLRSVQLYTRVFGVGIGVARSSSEFRSSTARMDFNNPDGSVRSENLDKRKVELLQLLNEEIADMKAMAQKIANMR